jgi:putative ABC transport system permease protein
LGASEINILVLLSKQFSKVVLIANIIAWPVAWYLMNRWLENFAYRIELTLWIFLLAGIIGLIIAIISVSLQAIKAALANPVDSLKYE